MTRALNAFPNNSFGLVQAAHLLINWGKAPDKKVDIDKEEKKEEEIEEEETWDNLLNFLREKYLVVKNSIRKKDYLGAAENLCEKVEDL